MVAGHTVCNCGTTRHAWSEATEAGRGRLPAGGCRPNGGTRTVPARAGGLDAARQWRLQLGQSLRSSLTAVQAASSQCIQLLFCLEILNAQSSLSSIQVLVTAAEDASYLFTFLLHRHLRLQCHSAQSCSIHILRLLERSAQLGVDLDHREGKALPLSLHFNNLQT